MRIFTLRWYTVFKWIRHIISTIVKGFKAKSLNAAGQSINSTHCSHER